MFGKHNLGGFVGFEQSEGAMNSFEAYRRDFLSGAIEELFAGGGDNQEATGTRIETSRRNIGRLSWNFQDKYLIDFNARYDGPMPFPVEGHLKNFFYDIGAKSQKIEACKSGIKTTRLWVLGPDAFGLSKMSELGDSLERLGRVVDFEVLPRSSGRVSRQIGQRQWLASALLLCPETVIGPYGLYL